MHRGFEKHGDLIALLRTLHGATSSRGLSVWRASVETDRTWFCRRNSSSSFPVASTLFFPVSTLRLPALSCRTSNFGCWNLGFPIQAYGFRNHGDISYALIQFREIGPRYSSGSQVSVFPCTQLPPRSKSIVWDGSWFMYKFNLDLVPFRAAYRNPVALTLTGGWTRSISMCLLPTSMAVVPTPGG